MEAAMAGRGALRRLDQRVLRLEDGALYVDLVETSHGLVRVGSMPDVSKLTARFGLQERAVVVPDWEVSCAGDNRTGEEFVQWRALLYGSHRRNYVGKKETLQTLYQNLTATFTYYFDREMTGIVQRRWLHRWFRRRPVEVSYEDGSLRIVFARGNIVISDENQRIYDRMKYRPPFQAEDRVEDVLAQVRPDSLSRDHLEITVAGSGNGFFGTTSSFLVRFRDRVLWIDPCAQPAHSLARVGVHWDDITHLLVTHNHEDHILGFSACLKRKTDRQERLELITAKSIYETLKIQFRPLFPEIDQQVEFTEIVPGKVLDLGGMKILSRWNHHFLPYGTLGLKITAGGRTWALSGDTKFDKRINQLLSRPELTESWFADCDLVFHEVDFDNPNSVHTYWRALEDLQRAIRAELYVYHTPNRKNPPLPIAAEGKTYRMG